MRISDWSSDVCSSDLGLGWLAIGGAALMSAYVLVADQRRVREQQAQAPEIYELSRLISANLDGGCLYVHRGLPIFYHLAGGCIATRYPFPDHLSLAIEGVALDVDPVAEVKRKIGRASCRENVCQYV